MPYLSNNYRIQPKSKIKSLIDATLFISFSAISILVVLIVLGWISTPR